MPVNKAANIRHEIIDECLRNTKRKWAKADLLKYINRRLELQYDRTISLSQLRYDIECMQHEYNAPIEMYRQGKNFYYRYSNPNFSIKNIPVSEEDIIKLNNAVNLLLQILGFTIAGEVAEIVQKLEARYDFNIEDRRNIIELETLNNNNNCEHLEDIYHAIIRMNVLKISYQPFHTSDVKVRIVHPYLLKKHDGIWYLICYCQKKENLDIFEIGQLKDVRIINLPFILDMSDRVEHYFENMIGISKPSSDIEEIVLKFSGYKAPYIYSYPIHSSQKIIAKNDDGSILVSLKVIINREFTNLLLSYGEDVQVLAPRPLAAKICETAKNLVVCYSKTGQC